MTTFGALSDEEVEALLRAQWIGRIAGFADGRPYIAPVSYVYDGRSVFGYTAAGLKLDMMRQSTQICFEVDDVRSPGEWQSVVGYGHFHELRESAALDALELLSAHLRTATGDTLAARTFVRRRGGFGLVYRLALIEKTGRFEREA